jgi:ABC-type multidrug transport system fused ATPase/permease subunit
MYKSILYKTFYLLDKSERKNIIIILLLTILSSFFDLAGIGLIITVLNIFVGDDFLKYTNYFFFLNDKSKEFILNFSLILLLGIHFLKFFILKFLAIKQSKLSHEFYLKISKKIFKIFLYKKYSFYLSNNSSILIRNVLSETNLFSFGIVYPLIKIFSEILIFICLSTVLLFYETNSSILTILFFSSIGYFLLKRNNMKLKFSGKERQIHSSEVLKQLQQSFTSIKEIIINNMENIFIEKFHYHNKESAKAGIIKDTISQTPRLILELIAVLTFVSLIIFLLNTGKSINETFVIVGVFFYVSLRLLPSISKIMQSIQMIKYNHAAAVEIFKYLFHVISDESRKDNIRIDHEHPLVFDKIIFNKTNFIYPNSKNKILNNINIEIKKGDKIGVIGKTGVGKSTFVNLICGLLYSSSGSIFIDTKEIKEIIPSWQKSIGYVPQVVSIVDESILFNITLNEDYSKVDLNKINELLKLVDMYDYIYKNFKNIYELAGENGIKLSGGERQRLGIARALYKSHSVLLLDEATSSLDEVTENFILSNVFKKDLQKTIISISHKKNSLKFCNRIFEINNGILKEII